MPLKPVEWDEQGNPVSWEDEPDNSVSVSAGRQVLGGEVGNAASHQQHGVRGFLTGVKESFVPEDFTPGDLVKLDRMMKEHPIDFMKTFGESLKGMTVDPMAAQWEKAGELVMDPTGKDDSLGGSAARYVEAGLRGAAGSVPLIGPAIMGLGETFESGQTARGLGNLAGMALGDGVARGAKAAAPRLASMAEKSAQRGTAGILRLPEYPTAELKGKHAQQAALPETTRMLADIGPTLTWDNLMAKVRQLRGEAEAAPGKYLADNPTGVIDPAPMLDAASRVQDNLTMGDPAPGPNSPAFFPKDNAAAKVVKELAGDNKAPTYSPRTRLLTQSGIDANRPGFEAALRALRMDPNLLDAAGLLDYWKESQGQSIPGRTPGIKAALDKLVAGLQESIDKNHPEYGKLKGTAETAKMLDEGMTRSADLADSAASSPWEKVKGYAKKGAIGSVIAASDRLLGAGGAEAALAGVGAVGAYKAITGSTLWKTASVAAKTKAAALLRSGDVAGAIKTLADWASEGRLAGYGANTTDRSKN